MELNVINKSVNNYDICIEASFEGLKEKIETLFQDAKKVCFISDENIWGLYKNALNLNFESFEYIVKPGEDSKSLDNATDICTFLLNNDFSRRDFIISFGGGVVSDLSGFVASIYKRGIGYINIPTSLLSMVDASVGGKTAVDFNGLKNMIGSFKNPSLVYINTEVLKTLPDKEFYSGFAEVMKASLIKDAKFYEWLIENLYEISDKDPAVISEMLEKSIMIKKVIVEKDPFETGERVLLNLGHTFGHAIEAVFKEYNHGEALALGCVAAAFISWKMDFLSMEEYYEIRDMFVPFNLPISFQIEDTNLIKEKIVKDKKNTDTLNMVLLKSIGKAVFVENIKAKLIDEALKELNFKDED